MLKGPYLWVRAGTCTEGAVKVAQCLQPNVQNDLQPTFLRASACISFPMIDAGVVQHGGAHKACL